MKGMKTTNDQTPAGNILHRIVSIIASVAVADRFTITIIGGIQMKQPEVYVDGILYKAHRMGWDEKGDVTLFTVKIQHELVNIFRPNFVTPYWHDKDDEGYKIEFPKEATV